MYTTFSEDIAAHRGQAWDNPYEGKDKKVVFVCTMGLLRSATAARLYAKRYNTRCAGSSPAALVPLSDALVEWADEIVFVNPDNYGFWKLRYGGDPSRHNIKVLNIEDNYAHMDPGLIHQFVEQYEKVE